MTVAIATHIRARLDAIAAERVSLDEEERRLRKALEALEPTTAATPEAPGLDAKPDRIGEVDGVTIHGSEWFERVAKVADRATTPTPVCPYQPHYPRLHPWDTGTVIVGGPPDNLYWSGHNQD